MLALIEAARLVDPNLRAQSRRLGELLKLREELALAIGGARWARCIRGTSVLTDKDVAFK
jgi:hypothetical protein